MLTPAEQVVFDTFISEVVMVAKRRILKRLRMSITDTRFNTDRDLDDFIDDYVKVTKDEVKMMVRELFDPDDKLPNFKTGEKEDDERNR